MYQQRWFWNFIIAIGSAVCNIRYRDDLCQGGADEVWEAHPCHLTRGGAQAAGEAAHRAQQGDVGGARTGADDRGNKARRVHVSRRRLVRISVCKHLLNVPEGGGGEGGGGQGGGPRIAAPAPIVQAELDRVT